MFFRPVQKAQQQAYEQQYNQQRQQQQLLLQQHLPQQYREHQQQQQQQQLAQLEQEQALEQARLAQALLAQQVDHAQQAQVSEQVEQSSLQPGFWVGAQQGLVQQTGGSSPSFERGLEGGGGFVVGGQSGMLNAEMLRPGMAATVGQVKKGQKIGRAHKSLGRGDIFFVLPKR